MHQQAAAHEGISHLGGATWNWTQQQVIDSIKSGSNTFYTLVGGKLPRSPS
ncbi:MAG: hypothetical protein WBE90_27235 [Xanthobacteraceae bacterium]